MECGGCSPPHVLPSPSVCPSLPSSGLSGPLHQPTNRAVLVPPLTYTQFRGCHFVNGLSIPSQELRSEVGSVSCLVAEHVSRFLERLAPFRSLLLFCQPLAELLFESFSTVNLYMVWGSYRLVDLSSFLNCLGTLCLC